MDMVRIDEQIQLKARDIFEKTTEAEFARGATDLQAYKRAQEAADSYADAMYRYCESTPGQ